MRYAFRAFGFLAFCLTLTSFCFIPAFAADGKTGVASGPVPEQAPAVPAKTSDVPRQAAKASPKTGQHPAGEDVAAAQAHNGWIKLEPGSRQAYVGIHGGTAPLSLMRSSDGVLFAFTGQTGNDFLHVLKGGNASRQSADHSGQHAAAGRTKESGATQAASAPQAARRHKNAGEPSVAPAAAAGPTAQSAPASKTAPSPNAGKAASAGASVPAAKRAPAKTPPAVTAQPPAKGEVLVFASGDAQDASEDYKPFGLTPPAGMSPEELRRQNGGLPPGQTPASYFGKPLKLGSYQAILNSGKV